MKELDIDEVIKWIVQGDNLSDTLIRVFEYNNTLHDISYLKASHGLYGYSPEVLNEAYRVIHSKHICVMSYDDVENFFNSLEFKDIVNFYQNTEIVEESPQN